MSDEIFFDGARFISANAAAASSDLTRDYIARLSRDGKIAGKRLGKNWYVQEASLKEFLVQREYLAKERGTSLSNERAREYQQAASPAATTASASIATQGLRDVHTKPAAPVAEGKESGKQLMMRAARIAQVPRQRMYTPVHAITPKMELVHKLSALTIALTLTFGTFALADPTYANYAAQSAHDEAQTFADAVHTITRGGAPALAANAQKAYLAAANDPAAALGSFSGALGIVARAWNAQVDSFVAATDFPQYFSRSPITGAFSAAGGELGQVLLGGDATSSIADLVTNSFSDASADLQTAIGAITATAVRMLGDAVYATTGVFNDIFAQRVHTDTLCVGTTCIDQQQLAALLAAAGQSDASQSGQGSDSGDASATSTPQTLPVISINGDNPATVDEGATYSDLGASITGPQADLDLGISASVDSASSTSMSDIIRDTSVPGSHTITYSATDQNGLTGTATRTVNVVAPASDTSDASSTDATSTNP